MTHRFIRIEQLLDAPLNDQLPQENLENLIDQYEDFDLEFKLESYDTSEAKKAELAKDVAAFANASGGVLVIGMAEVNGKASKAIPVSIGDDQVRHLRSVIAQRIRPSLPNFPILQIASKEDSKKGFLLLLVPRSDGAPHACVIPNKPELTYSVRHGSQTVFLSESELANRYRNRFEWAQKSESRLHELSEVGIKSLDLSEPWVCITVHPTPAGEFVVDGKGRSRLGEWLRASEPLRIAGKQLFRVEKTNPSTGFRHYFVGDANDQGIFSSIKGEFHSDGSTFLAHSLPQTADVSYSIDDQAVIEIVAAFLKLGAAHAVNSGVEGDGLVELQLVEPGRGTIPVQSMWLFVQHSLGGSYGSQKLPGGRGVFEAPTVRRVLNLGAIYSSPLEQLLGTKMLCGDIFQAFGLSEPLHISADGSLRTRYFGNQQKEYEQWAVDNNVAISGDSVPI